MTADEADQLIDLIATNQTLSLLDRAAWHRVLAPWSVAEASDRIVDVKTRQRFVNPSDLNVTQPAAELDWGAAWSIYLAKTGDLGSTADYGHPTINAVAARIRLQVQRVPAADARWMFRDAWLAFTSPASPDALPALDAGHQVPELEA